MAGCEKAMRNMYEQPKYRPLVASSLWPDGQSARPLVPGVIVRSAGDLAASSSGRLGEIALSEQTLDGQAPSSDGIAPPAAHLQAASAPSLTIAALRRGRERYDIYCAPCHSASGDGDGMVVRRGFPAPGSLHSAAMRSASDAHLFEVIGDGYGIMYPFADRIEPSDRWAIVGYVRRGGERQICPKP